MLSSIFHYLNGYNEDVSKADSKPESVEDDKDSQDDALAELINEQWNMCKFTIGDNQMDTPSLIDVLEGNDKLNIYFQLEKEYYDDPGHIILNGKNEYVSCIKPMTDLNLITDLFYERPLHIDETKLLFVFKKSVEYYGYCENKCIIVEYDSDGENIKENLKFINVKSPVLINFIKNSRNCEYEKYNSLMLNDLLKQTKLPSNIIVRIINDFYGKNKKDHYDSKRYNYLMRQKLDKLTNNMWQIDTNKEEKNDSKIDKWITSNESFDSCGDNYYFDPDMKDIPTFQDILNGKNLTVIVSGTKHNKLSIYSTFMLDNPIISKKLKTIIYPEEYNNGGFHKCLIVPYDMNGTKPLLGEMKTCEKVSIDLLHMFYKECGLPANQNLSKIFKRMSYDENELANLHNLNYNSLKEQTTIKFNFSNELINYAVINCTNNDKKQIVLVNIDHCLESFPCIHNIIHIYYNNIEQVDKIINKSYYSDEILNLYYDNHQKPLEHFIIDTVDNVDFKYGELYEYERLDNLKSDDSLDSSQAQLW